MRKVRVHTLSGSVYGFDLVLLTWERLNSRPIVGLDRDSGRLHSRPTFNIGGRLRFDDSVVGTITTTPVSLLEVTEW